jgi:guanylate kinase
MLVSISGPSGAGKSTLIRGLTDVLGVKTVNSWTTREPRPDDKNMNGYKYLSKNDYLEIERSEGFLLSNIIAGQKYGTMKDDMAVAIDADRIWLTDLTGSSVLELVRLGYSPKVALVLMVNYETSKDRMVKRGDSESEITKRLARYKEEETSCFEILKKIERSILINGDQEAQVVIRESLEAL